jgi:hypothetical protein
MQHNEDVSPESTEFVTTLSEYEKKFLIYVQFILSKDQARNLCFGSEYELFCNTGITTSKKFSSSKRQYHFKLLIPVKCNNRGIQC